MANPTTNLSMTKPTVGGSTDTWGTTLNENVVDIIDALFSISGTDVTMSDIKFNSMSVQETGAGTDTVKIQAPAAVTTSYTLTMPAAVGSTNQVLSAADGSGTLAWTTPETGDITAVTAGTGMTGGGSSGDVTLNVIGTADKITVSADALTIASTYVGQTSITTLGTIATGTWEGTTVAVNQGGTGLASYAAGDVIYASGATTLAKLAKGSDTEVLTLASGVPTWAAPTVGDITGVTAGTGLSGGGTSGTVTLNVEAAQTQITSVGALAAGSISSGFGAIDVGSSSIDGGTITADTGLGVGSTDSLDSTSNRIQFYSASSTAQALIQANRSALGDVEILSANSQGITLVPASGTATIDGALAVGSVTSTSTVSATTLTGTLSTAAQTNITSVGTLTSLGVGAITSTGAFVTSSTGPHAIGGAVNADAQLTLLGSYQGNRALGISSSLTPNVGEYGTAVNISPTLIEAASGTHAVMAGLYVEGVPITTAGGATSTLGSSVYIGGPATGAATNYSLFVASGDVSLAATAKLYLDGGGDTYLFESSGNNVQFFVGGAMRFDLGIGHIAIPATNKLYLDGGSNTYIVENSADVIRCVAGGSGGVDLTSGATSWAAVSDVREKVESDFEPITDALTKVASLRSVIGRYIVDSPDRRRAFLIGQDVQAVLPEAVTEDPDGVLSLAYTETIPLLVAALNEGSARIRALETALAAL